MNWVDANTLAYLPLTSDLSDQCGNTWAANGGAAISDGSLYLDGVDDYISFAGISGAFSGQFTIEMYMTLIAADPAGIIFCQAGNNGGIQFGGYAQNDLGLAMLGMAWQAHGWSWPTTNQKLHIALSRDASNVVRYFIGGAVSASVAVDSSYIDGKWVVGGNSAGLCINAKINNLRVSNICRYSSVFTPPVDNVFIPPSPICVPSALLSSISISGGGY